MAAILDSVKTALRINHNKLDAEITRQITAAEADMERVGIAAAIVQAGGPLIEQAIITYCQMLNTEEAGLIDLYARAYELQIDGIRKANQTEEAGG